MNTNSISEIAVALPDSISIAVALIPLCILAFYILRYKKKSDEYVTSVCYSTIMKSPIIDDLVTRVKKLEAMAELQRMETNLRLQNLDEKIDTIGAGVRDIQKFLIEKAHEIK